MIAFGLLAALALACDGAGKATQGAEDDPKPDRPASMAALGDSITAGYGSCITLVACTNNSWATGDSSRVDSHYRRIRDDNDRITGKARNFAVPGAEAAGLAAQADRAVAAKVEYVTILIGANDACAPTVAAMTTPAGFRKQVRAALTRLKKGLPKARILVASIPDLHRLWELGHDDPKAVRAWDTGICPSLLARATSTARADDRRRDQVDERVDAYNDELEAACAAYGKRCRWDGGSVHRVPFGLDLVNRLDYFHPDADGQRRIAEVTYPGRFTW